MNQVVNKMVAVANLGKFIRKTLVKKKGGLDSEVIKITTNQKHDWSILP